MHIEHYSGLIGMRDLDTTSTKTHFMESNSQNASGIQNMKQHLLKHRATYNHQKPPTATSKTFTATHKQSNTI